MTIAASLVLLSLAVPATTAFLAPPPFSAAAAAVVVSSSRLNAVASRSHLPRHAAHAHAPSVVRRPPPGVSASNDDDIILDDESDAVIAITTMARRSFLLRTGGALAALSSTTRPTVARAAATAAETATTYAPYVDAEYGFRVLLPSSWERSEQTLSGRRRAIFYTDPYSRTAVGGGGDIETLCIVAYTPVRDDFTSLSSFGSVDEVGQSTILPKELAGGDGSTSTMISSTSRRNAYYFDYSATPTVPRERLDSSGIATMAIEPRHFRTIFALLPPVGDAAAGMTLVTITLQTTEGRYADAKAMFDGIIDSYEKIK